MAEKTLSESVCNESSNSLDTSLSVLGDFFERELETGQRIRRENIKTLHNMCKEVENLKMFHLKNPVAGQCENILQSHLNIKRQFLTTEKLQKYYENCVKEKNNVLNNIEQLQKQIENVNVKIKETKRVRKITKKKFKLQEMALNTAATHYQKIFGFNIEIQRENDDVLLATVHFANNENMPIKFTISKSQNKIMNFDIRSLSAEIQTDVMKKEFLNNNNFIGLLSQLCKIIQNYNK